MNAPLDSVRWQRVKDIFHAVADLPAAGRTASLDAQCGGDAAIRREVESLLASDAPADADPAIGRAVDAAIALAADAVGLGQRVGPYRILREIGQGGMATVFLAVRDDDEFRQRVAIKVVRGALSAEALRRFRGERQILASLEHPAIARLLDGGTTPGGLPYLVMEYLDGQPIDEFCRERKLTIRDRLLLFCRVCDAVSHAHRGLVVHRDIKPSNILVLGDPSTPLGAGVPKLLDFGIATLIDEGAPAGASITQTGLRALTPEYASPELVRGDVITTATDVYSLGVVLYELLTDERPLVFDTRQSTEIERVVCTVEPRKPSTVAPSSRHARQLAGDLDTIVLTALQKEPARRYPSAAHLAEDIRRHLEGRPVVARPATFRYRSSRFVRRHRAGVAVAAAVALLIVSFAIVLGFQMRRVARERDTAEQVSKLLLELYASFDPSQSRGAKVTAQDVLDRGAARILAEMTDQPEVQTRMLDAIGFLYRQVGLSDRAIAVLRSSLAIRQASGMSDSPEAAKTLNPLAVALASRERFGEAAPLARQALEIRRRSGETKTADLAEVLNTVGFLQYHRSGLEGARFISEAVDIWRVTKGADSSEFASAVATLARTWLESADFLKEERVERGELLKAERVKRELLAARRIAVGDATVLTALALKDVGTLLVGSGRNGEAEPLLREALATRLRLPDSDGSMFVADVLHILGNCLQNLGRADEAEQSYREAVGVFQRALAIHGADLWSHPLLAVTINNLAATLEDQGRFDEAEAAFRQAIDLRRRLLGPDDPVVARTLDNLARLLVAQARYADALPIADEAMAIRGARLGDRDYETATSMVRKALILDALGRRAEAAPLVRAAHAVRAAALPPDDPRLRDETALLARLR